MLIDVDTGVGDSIALLYALCHPEIELAGITTQIHDDGGTLEMRGNISPVAEANVAGDPLACDNLRAYPVEAKYVGLSIDVDPDRAIGELLSVFYES